MTLTEARSLTRQFARSASSSSAFDNTAVDNAIKVTGYHYVRETRCTRTLTTGAVITADTATVDLSALTTFRPELFFWARVNVAGDYTLASTRYGIDKVDFTAVKAFQGSSCEFNEHFAGDYSSGVPRVIGFKSWTAAEVHPLPASTGTITISWSEPFTTFTAGTASPDGVTLNVPNDLIHEMIVLGASAILQLTDPEAVNSALRAGAFAEFVSRTRGAGSISGNISFRSSLRGR